MAVNQAHCRNAEQALVGAIRFRMTQIELEFQESNCDTFFIKERAIEAKDMLSQLIGLVKRD